MKRKEMNEVWMKAARKVRPDASCMACTKSHCCKGQKDIAVSEKWIKEIKYLITPQQRARAMLSRKDGRVDCPFLSLAGTCEIYENRPFVCASYHVLCKPEDCDTTKKLDGISMVNPGAIAMAAKDIGGQAFLDAMEPELDGEIYGIMDAFRV